MRHSLRALTGTARALHRLYILLYMTTNLFSSQEPPRITDTSRTWDGMWVRATADQVTGVVPWDLAGSWESSDAMGEKFCSAANILTKGGCWESCCPSTQGQLCK